jgi:hypothetical protein
MVGWLQECGEQARGHVGPTTIIVVLLLALPRVGLVVLVITALVAATIAIVVFCYSIVSGCHAKDKLKLGERPDRRLGERTEGVEPG